MTIDDTLLNKLQKLASLEIDSSRIDDTKNNLSEIVNFVENINNLNLNDIEASFSSIKGSIQMREDDVRSNAEARKIILDNAPQSEDNFFIVPKIIE